MVKLGEIVGSPKLLSVVKNIILNSLRTRLTEVRNRDGYITVIRMTSTY